MRRVLIVRANTTSPRVRKESLSLTKAGYNVSLFLWERRSNASMDYMENNLHIYKYGFKAPFGKYVVLYWIFWWQAIFRFIAKNDFEIIHVCGLDSYLPVVLAKFLKGYKIVYDIFDFMADSMPRGTPTILQRFVRSLERYLTEYADTVVVVDDVRRPQLEGVNVRRCEVIMNCVDDEYRLEKIKNGQFMIFYGGMLSQTRGLNQILEAIEGDKSIRLVVAGGGEDEKLFRDIFKSYSNVEFLGQVDHVTAIRLTSQSDVVFGFYDPAIPINRLASPNKLFEAMMCRTPIIVNEETTMAKTVKSINCGIVVPYGDTEALMAAINLLKSRPELCRELGENGHRAYVERYNWTIMEQRLIDLYSELLVIDDSTLS